jgi:Helix-turn-helix domain
VSIDAIALVYRVQLGSPAAKAVLLSLAERADESWSCYPGMTDISTRTELSYSTVKRQISELEKNGWISHRRLRRADGTAGVYRYKLNFHALKNAAAELPEPVENPEDFENQPGLTVSPRSSNQGSQCPRLGLTVSHPRAHSEPAEPSTNRQVNLIPSEAIASSGETRARRIPNGWAPSSEDSAFAIENGLTADRIKYEAAKFRDYFSAASGKSAAKKDWSATWRNWVRRATEKKDGVAPPKNQGALNLPPPNLSKLPGPVIVGKNGVWIEYDERGQPIIHGLGPEGERRVY